MTEPNQTTAMTAVQTLEQLATAAHELAAAFRGSSSDPTLIVRRMQQLDIAQKSMTRAVFAWVKANPAMARRKV